MVGVEPERVGRSHVDRAVDVVGSVAGSTGAVVVADAVVQACVRVGRIAVRLRGRAHGRRLSRRCGGLRLRCRRARSLRSETVRRRRRGVLARRVLARGVCRRRAGVRRSARSCLRGARRCLHGMDLVRLAAGDAEHDSQQQPGWRPSVEMRTHGDPPVRADAPAREATVAGTACDGPKGLNRGTWSR